MADSRTHQTDIAWAAGFLDGEGCFGLFKCSGKNPHDVSRRIYVGATQIGSEMLDELAVLLGGKVRKQRINEKGQEIFQWQITSAEDVKRAIPLLLPYLRRKRREAEIVLAYAEFIKRRGRAAEGKTVFSQEEIIGRQELIDEMFEIRNGVLA